MEVVFITYHSLVAQGRSGTKCGKILEFQTKERKEAKGRRSYLMTEVIYNPNLLSASFC